MAPQLTRTCQQTKICLRRMNACQRAVDTSHLQQTNACQQVQATQKILRPVLMTCRGGRRLSKQRLSVLHTDGGVVPSRSASRLAVRQYPRRVPPHQVELLQILEVATTAATTRSWGYCSSQLRPVVAATYPLHRAQSLVAKAAPLAMGGVRALLTDDQEF